MELDAMDDNPNWLLDYGVMDDLSAANFTAPPPAVAFTCSWPSVSTATVSTEIGSSFVDFEGLEGTRSWKRLKSETRKVFGSKAGREKLRRNRMNERFMELGSILEAGKSLKTDKSAIIDEAIRMITRLRSETERLGESNVDLQEKIKELKAEKNELREEKQRLKADRDKLERQVKSMSGGGQPGYLPHPHPPMMRPVFPSQGHAALNKLMPFVGYPSIAMWQFMTPSVVDTTQDHVLRPPVA